MSSFKKGLTENFRGTTNSFSTGSGSSVLVIPKSIINDLNFDLANKKAHFHIYFNKKTKEIIYKFIGEEKK